LTLVVDERVDDTLENRGIQPLPNLDFKFVTANSLISLPKLSAQGELFDDNTKIEELKELRDRYFNARDDERKDLMLEFSDLQSEMINSLIDKHSWAGVAKAELTRKLTDWKPFKHKSTDWFDPEWMFGIKDGFDIVIANPPYDVYQGDKKEDIDDIKKLDIYPLAKGGKLNMYKLFLARSSQLQKEGGILCEIFQNSFLADNAAKNIRKYFLTEQKIIRIDSFPERDDHKRRVFEAVKMSVCILAAVKNKLTDYSFKLHVWESKEMEKGYSVDYEVSEIHKIDSNSYQIPLLKSEEKSLFSKLYSHPHAPISCIEGELNMTFHKDYFTQDPDKPKIIKGAAVQRYRLTDNLSQGEIAYLDKVKYLRDFGSSKKSQHFKNDRLAMQGITGVDDNRRLIMALVPSGMFCANSCNYILSNSSNYSLYFLLGLFNSKLMNWLFKKTSTNSNVNCYEIENLPVPQINNKNKALVTMVESLIDELLSKEIDLNNSSSFEIIMNTDTQIDKLIYDLYDLSDDETAIVEASIL
jgi:Alw26I/Eco31I/Esp3I family type II restriction m6 adenine DNA methyltransferase